MSMTQKDFAETLGLPKDAVAVNRRVWFLDQNGNRAVFVEQTPFYSYPIDDPVLNAFCAIQLVEAGLARVNQVCLPFQIHSRKFPRLRSKFRQRGIEGLSPPLPSGTSMATP